MNGRYILIGQTVVPCEDLMEWGRWLEEADRIVFQTNVGAWFVSTVFLGLDHAYPRGTPPLLFETMIFLRAAERKPGESLDAWCARTEPLRAAADQEMIHYQRRYSDWSEAEAGHESTVRFAEKRTGKKREPAPVLIPA